MLTPVQHPLQEGNDAIMTMRQRRNRGKRGLGIKGGVNLSEITATLQHFLLLSPLPGMEESKEWGIRLGE